MFDWFEAGNNSEQYMVEERLGGGCTDERMSIHANCIGRRRGVYECEEFFSKGLMMLRRVRTVVY